MNALGRAAALLLLLVAGASACSGEKEPPAAAGASGGASNAANTGGEMAHGGSRAGGVASGGMASGGSPTSGAPNTGGAKPSGGSSAGSGGAVGGAAGAATATGGAPTGGSAGSDSPVAGSANGGSGATAGAGGASTGGAGIGGDGGTPNGGDPKLLIFLLLGQSNMVGQPQPEPQDREQDPRIQVLAYDDCSNVNRKYNQWYTASPPLHQCDAGVGPGDYFAKTLLASLPEGYRIGLVPCAVNGAPIDLFRKGVPRTGWELPPDDHWETGYEWIMSRAREAQKAGVIRGILFHQGESDSEQMVWVDKVKGLVEDLRADLGIGEVPFLAGELYYDGCCRPHNALVQQLAREVTNGISISASGLEGTDQYHFDLAAQRELGKRYGAAMQQVLRLP